MLVYAATAKSFLLAKFGSTKSNLTPAVYSARFLINSAPNSTLLIHLPISTHPKRCFSASGGIHLIPYPKQLLSNAMPSMAHAIEPLFSLKLLAA